MKIAVTSQNRKAVTGHAGRCRNFWMFDVEGTQISSRELLELAKEDCFHDRAPEIAAPLEAVDVLIVGGMGAGLRTRLLRKGIRVIVTDEKDPERAVRRWLEGTLSEVAADSDCRHEAGH